LRGLISLSVLLAFGSVPEDEVGALVREGFDPVARDG
jgi:hypothetical protein